MKRLLFASILVVFASNTAFGQSPQAPDKNPPIQQSYAAPQAVAVQQQYVARVVATPVQLVQPYAVQQVAQSYAVGSHCVGVNRGNFGVNRFNNFGGGFGAGNVSISAVDRRGTQVVANGANRVRIERGFLGRIRGARAN